MTAARRRSPIMSSNTGGAMDESVTLRFAFPDDDRPLARLAALDSAEPPPGPILLAEVAGELRAALSLSDGSVIANPFHPTATLVELLAARARQLTAAGARPPRAAGAPLLSRVGWRLRLRAWG